MIELIEEACTNGARLFKATQALGISLKTYKRWKKVGGTQDKRNGPISTPGNKLSDKEKESICEIVNSKEYCDLPVNQIIPDLADKGIYIASESSFYRVLREKKWLTHRGKSKPKTYHKIQGHIAKGPNELWSWDITYLPTDIRGKYFYLYLIMDLFSRKIVGFDVFAEESAENASKLITKACILEKITPEQLTLHSDNGSPMKGATMLSTLYSLGVASSFSRPAKSNDNAYSEALFKTLKYCQQYPHTPFKTILDANKWVERFVEWYNNSHRHSAIKFVTPDSRHKREDIIILGKRKKLYEEAKQKNPKRWSKKIKNWDYIKSVGLNSKPT